MYLYCCCYFLGAMRLDISIFFLLICAEHHNAKTITCKMFASWKSTDVECWLHYDCPVYSAAFFPLNKSKKLKDALVLTAAVIHLYACLHTNRFTCYVKHHIVCVCLLQIKPYCHFSTFESIYWMKCDKTALYGFIISFDILCSSH